MIHTIQFNKLSAMLLDFVDDREGFLFLRMCGAETVVNAIWAKLSAREDRGKKWGGEVSIPMPGRSYPQYVAAQKSINYRTVRSRLPSGLVDLALVHPILTVAEDRPEGWYLLSYEAETPPGFFDRLNKVLSIPLKLEWADWLWQVGQQPQAFQAIQTREVWQNGHAVEQSTLIEVNETPIVRLESLGEVACYVVRCEGYYRAAWLQIIRRQLDLSIQLKRVTGGKGGYHYHDEPWTIYQTDTGWALHQHEALVIQAPSLPYVLTQARETLGIHFIIAEAKS